MNSIMAIKIFSCQCQGFVNVLPINELFRSSCLSFPATFCPLVQSATVRRTAASFDPEEAANAF